MPVQQNAASKHSTKIFSLFISASYNLLNSTHKCNLSVRPFVMVAKLAKKYSRGVGKPSFPLVHLVSASLSLLLSMTLPPFHQARITNTYRLLCHLWQAMLSYASCLTVSNSKMVIFQTLTGKGIYLSCFELLFWLFPLI